VGAVGKGRLVHPYSIDVTARSVVDGALFVLALILGTLGYRGLGLAGVDPPWWLDVPGVIGVFSGLRLWFEHQVWRWRWIARAHGVPDLRGRWTGFGLSSFDGFAKSRDFTLDIRQSWSRIEVSLNADASRSSSYAAMISCDQACPELLYAYRNRPSAATRMPSFAGVATLRLEEGTLQGDYFTDGARGNSGTLEFEPLTGTDNAI